MNIFRFEIKMYIKSIIWWMLTIIFILFSFMSIYPVFSKDASLIEKMMENYPKELMQAFGVADGIVLVTLPGFFAMCFVYIQICLAIQGGNYGFSCLSVEERELTADFLMTRPVSRSKVIINKFLAALVAMFLTNIGISFFSYLVIELFGKGKEYSKKGLLLLLVSGFVFQLIYFSIGVFVSVLTKKIKSVISYSLGLAFGTYIANALKNVIGVELLGYISPFNYFNSSDIFINVRFEIKYIIISLFIITISLIGSYLMYLRRNIHSV